MEEDLNKNVNDTINSIPFDAEVVYKFTRPNNIDASKLGEAIFRINIEGKSTDYDYNYWNELLNLLQEKKYSDMINYIKNIIVNLGMNRPSSLIYYYNLLL